MSKLRNSKGFTLLEVIIVLAVFAILAAALFPRLSRILEDSKISRAQTEVDNIGSAVNNFNSHTTYWPSGDGSTIGGTPLNIITTLISGTITVDGTAATSYADTTVMPLLPAAGSAEQWNTTPVVDYFDNHLRLNNPNNKCVGVVGGCDFRYFPPEAVTVGTTLDSTAFATAVNQTRDPWRGPYLDVLRYDPWSRRYIANIESAWSTQVTNQLISIAISAGPDSIIQTDGDVDDTEFNTFKVRNDDVAYVIRKRAGSL